MLVIAFGVGSQDETISPIHTNDLLNFRKTLLFGSIFAFLGVIFFSHKVGQTIGVNLLGSGINYTQNMMLAVLLGVMIWILLATWRNLPVSITHSILGALFGIALIWSITSGQPYSNSMNWGNVGVILLGLAISPAIGYLFAYIAQLSINRVFHRYATGLIHLERAEKKLVPWVLVFAALNAISRSGNDSGKVIGAAFSLLSAGLFPVTDPIIPIIIIALTYASGLYFVGRNLVKSIGGATGEHLRPSEALPIEISVSLILFVASFFGLPISGTQVLVFALVGSARVRGEKPDPKIFRSTIISWVLTIPVSALLGVLFYFIVPIV